MKRSLLLAAMLSALSTVAYAQSSVTAYGVVDAGVSYIDTGTGYAWKVTSGNQSTSRIGFRGTEDLGNGLSALFTLETGINVGDGKMNDFSNGRLFDRQSFIGLKSNWGTLKLGRQETPMYAAYNKSVDPFARGLTGDISRLFPIATISTNSGTSRHASTTRSDNTINYSLPGNLGGLYGEAAVTLGGVAGALNQGSQHGLNVGYLNGPFNVIYAYHKARSIPVAPAAMITGRSHFLASTYDFKVLKLYAALGTDENDVVVGATRTDTRSKMFGVSAPFGAHSVMFSYTLKSDFTLASANAKQMALAYTYTLSKRTNFYAGYSRTENDVAGLTNVTVAGTANKWLVTGVRHSF